MDVSRGCCAFGTEVASSVLMNTTKQSEYANGEANAVQGEPCAGGTSRRGVAGGAALSLLRNGGIKGQTLPYMFSLYMLDGGRAIW